MSAKIPLQPSNSVFHDYDSKCNVLSHVPKWLIQFHALWLLDLLVLFLPFDPNLKQLHGNQLMRKSLIASKQVTVDSGVTVSDMWDIYQKVGFTFYDGS